MKKVFFILLMVAMGHKALAQLQLLQFEIFHNEKRVGSMSISKTGNAHRYTIKSNFTVRINLVLKNIQVQGYEVSNFEDGILQTSIVLRKVNGKVKANKQTRKIASGYQVSGEGLPDKVIPLQKIRSNLMSIFFSEPVNNQQVFSDNQQVLLHIVQKSANVYQITLPNGDFNSYTYSYDKCALVELTTKWATLVLRRTFEIDPGYPRD